MSRRPATFTQADVARALRALEQVGAKAVVEIGRDGTIRIVPEEHKPKPEPVDEGEAADI